MSSNSSTEPLAPETSRDASYAPLARDPRLRILYTHRTQGVGAEGVHIMGMVEAFRESGHEVEMDCLAGCDPFERNVAPERGDGADEGRKPGGGRGRSLLKSAYRLIAERSPQFVFGMVELLYNIPLLFRLRRRLRRRPDFVYERYAVGNFAPALLCRLMRIPLIVEVNDSVVIERSRPPSFPRLKRVIEGRILRSADLVITITERFKSQLLEAFPEIPESAIRVLPNAVSKRRWMGPHDEGRGARRAGLGLDCKFLLGSAGQFLPWHGLAPFIQATADVAKARDLGYLFIGDGPSRPEVLEVARACGIEGRVVFTGTIPSGLVPNHLALLDIAVIPAAAEHASPMKLIEFMAMGLPVIAPDQPNIREALEDEGNGKLFQPGDMGDMRRSLVEVLDHWEAAREMGVRSRDHVFINHTWCGHASKILEAIHRP